MELKMGNVVNDGIVSKKKENRFDFQLATSI